MVKFFGLENDERPIIRLFSCSITLHPSFSQEQCNLILLPCHVHGAMVKLQISQSFYNSVTSSCRTELVPLPVHEQEKITVQ